MDEVVKKNCRVGITWGDSGGNNGGDRIDGGGGDHGGFSLSEGYVGWIHSEGLNCAIAQIKRDLT